MRKQTTAPIAAPIGEPLTEMYERREALCRAADLAALDAIDRDIAASAALTAEGVAVKVELLRRQAREKAADFATLLSMSIVADPHRLLGRE
jgi:hypothetical protein